MFQTKTDGHSIINCIEAETEWIARVRAVCGSTSSDQMYCNFLGLGWWFLRLRAGVVIYIMPHRLLISDGLKLILNNKDVILSGVKKK